MFNDSHLRGQSAPFRQRFGSPVAVGKLPDELLNGEMFYTVAEECVLIERWREHYNRVRPHSALGYRPPAPEAIAAGPSYASLRAVEQRPSDRTTTA